MVGGDYVCQTKFLLILIKICAVQCIAFLHGSSVSIFLLFVSVSPSHKTTKLTVSKITQAGFPPKEMVTYSKETQTPTETPDDEGEFSIFYLYLIFYLVLVYYIGPYVNV